MMRRAQCILALACAAFAGGALAQTASLPDPTRPPPGWLPKDPNAPAVSETKDEAPVQLVLTGQTRRFAIVRGDLLSDKGKGSRVVEIRRDDVVVQSDRGRETLSLFPDVKKTPSKTTAGVGHKDQK